MDLLSQIATKYDTDKGLQHHAYTPTYDKLFNHLRHDVKTFLEVGIGGYEFPDRGGGSLKMWQEYFTNAEIHGIDLYDKSKLDAGRITTWQGSQDDGTFINEVISQIGQPDIIIDDASHINALTIQTFKLLFPHLKSGGIYVVEDVHTNYWADHYGGSQDIKDREYPTVMNFFLDLAHEVNRDWIVGHESLYQFKSIQFVKSLIIIHK
jgi:hypothetical protein